MMETLNITWDNGKGRMSIFLDKFFPSTKKDLKKLLSIISLDWQHEDELKDKLKVYFQDKKAEHEKAKKYSAKMHLENRQLEADSKEMVTTRKRPNGVSLSKDELAEEKKRSWENTRGMQQSIYRITSGMKKRKSNFQSI